MVLGRVTSIHQQLDKVLDIGTVVVLVGSDHKPLHEDVGDEDSRIWIREIVAQHLALETLQLNNDDIH